MNTSGRLLRTRQVLCGLVVLSVVGLGACSSDKDSETGKSGATTESTAAGSGAEETTTTAEQQTLKILVSNDDGYDAPGIDAVVRALKELPDTEVVVAAPATQQSGKGSAVTEGELAASERQTKSGFPAFAVEGTPADSVNWALEGGVEMKPDLVVTGINAGQNLGKIADQISGTVGAARAATSRGIPALATSLGSDSVENINQVVDESQFETAAKYVVGWVKEHRDGLLEGKYKDDFVLLENLNVPFCTAGQPRGVAQVELAPTGEMAIASQDCASTVSQPADDITAFNNGFVTISSMPLEPAPAD